MSEQTKNTDAPIGPVTAQAMILGRVGVGKTASLMSHYLDAAVRSDGESDRRSGGESADA